MALLLIALNCVPEESACCFMGEEVHRRFPDPEDGQVLDGSQVLTDVISAYQTMSSGLVLSCAFLSIESVTDYHLKSWDYLLLDAFQ